VLAGRYLALAALLALTPAASAQVGDWATWGNSSARTGRATASQIRAGNAPKLVKAWSRTLDGYVDAQPLYAHAVAIPGGPPQDVYIAATESGSVYAIAATTGRVLWRATLGATLTGCPQIPNKTYGVTGAPTYDAARHAVYVASRSLLWGLDVTTGKPLPGWPIQLPFDENREHVWGAITQHGQFLYLATASYCDKPPYKGRLFRVDVTDQALKEWDPVPTPGPNGGGAIWGWGGVSIDPITGHVWAATGNAIGPDVKNEADYDAESVVELDGSLNRLHGSHAPGVPTKGDYDFGATPLLFSPIGCGPVAAAENKDGSLYLWHRATLDSGPYQQLELSYPAILFGLPAWDPVTQTLFLTTTIGTDGVEGGLQAIRMSGCRARLVWTRELGKLLNSVPTVVNNVVAVGTGSGHLRLFRTTDGKPLLDRALGKPLFAAPISVGGDLAIAGWTRRLDVFRLPPSARGGTGR
jgi:outer membrane protein assembly factor BamB